MPGKRAKPGGRVARPQKLPPPLESEVQRVLLDWLHLKGLRAWRFNSGAMTKGGRHVRFNTAKGCSDILFIGPRGDSRFGALEVKRPGGKLTDDQAEFLRQVREAGGIAICASSVEELEEGLRAAGIQL